jgi:outer membrane protein TolC
MKSMFMLITFTSVSVLAQPLSDFLKSADENNFDRRIASEQMEKAAADAKVAWTALLPSLTIQGGWTHNQYAAEASLPNGMGGVNKLVITPADQFDAIFRVDLPLVDVARWFRTSAAFKGEDGAKHREAMMRDVVKRQVAQTYFGYAAALAVNDSAKKSASVAEAQLKLMEIRQGVGSITELELLRAKSEVQRTKQVVIDTETLVATMAMSLATLTGITPAASIALPDVKAESFDGKMSVEELPALKAAQTDIDSASALATASKFQLIPTLNAQFTQRLSNATGFQGQAATYNLGINFLWRLDGPTVMNMGSMSHVENTARIAQEKTRRQLEDGLKTDLLRFNAAKSKVETARVQVEVATKAAQIAKDRYAAGASTQVDVIQAERDLFGAEVGQIQAKTELASARVSVALSAGLPIE